MALLVQNNDGTIAGATSYVSVTDFQAYHSTRGNSLTAYTTEQQEVALTKATDYLDHRFAFVGCVLNGRDQSTKWPRYGAYDVDELLVNGIPTEVIQATCEYAYRALSTPLYPDPTRDASGREIQSISNVAGPVSQSITYADGGGGGVTFPEYPAADQILQRSGLVCGGGFSIDIVRA